MIFKTFHIRNSTALRIQELTIKGSTLFIFALSVQSCNSLDLGHADSSSGINSHVSTDRAPAAAVLSYQPSSVQNLNLKVAKAYIQAVTDGPDRNSKIVRDALLPNKQIDFNNCFSTLSLDSTTCQRPVYNGKDGKTIFMEVLTEKNIFEILPPANARKALTMPLFHAMADPANTLFSNLNEGNNKKILREYLAGISAYGAKDSPSQGAFTYFDDIFETGATEIAIDFKVELFPKWIWRFRGHGLPMGGGCALYVPCFPKRTAHDRSLSRSLELGRTDHQQTDRCCLRPRIDSGGEILSSRLARG